MKFEFLLGLFLVGNLYANAQNTDPWPATGNVGIGTSTPTATLHLHSATSNVNLLKISDATYSSTLRQSSYNTTFDASATFRVNFGNTTDRSFFILEGNSGKFWLSANYGAFVNGYQGFKVGHAEKFGFYTNGTTTVYNAIGSTWTDNNNSGLAFFTRNAGTEAEMVRLTNTGRLGIGTTAPSTLLHVNGEITINSAIRGDATHSVLVLSGANGSRLSWGTGATQSAVVCGGPVTFQTNNLERVRINPNGAVGINTNGPTATLHSKGTVRLEDLVDNDTKDYVIAADVNGNLFKRQASTLGGGSGSSWALGGSSVAALQTFGTVSNYDLPVITNNTERLRITASGNVGIGVSNPLVKLAVKGDIHAQKVKVTATGWADYVFADGYKLPSLAEVEAFIKKNKHLPEVPTAKEVEANGVDLGNNQALLLKKIEELTLYVIEQQKQIEQMKIEMKEMKQKQ